MGEQLKQLERTVAGMPSGGAAGAGTGATAAPGAPAIAPPAHGFSKGSADAALFFLKQLDARKEKTGKDADDTMAKEAYAALLARRSELELLSRLEKEQAGKS